MKKLITILMIFAVLFAGCGSSKPRGMADETYEVMQSAINYTKKFINGDVDREHLVAYLEACDSDLDSFELEGEEADYNSYASTNLAYCVMMLTIEDAGGREVLKKLEELI